jgi:hypothetical protein
VCALAIVIVHTSTHWHCLFELITTPSVVTLGRSFQSLDRHS